MALLLKTLSTKRVLNAAASAAGYIYSSITKRNHVWGKPLILSVEPTNICNLKCPLCVTGNGSLTRNTGMMSLDTFEKVLSLYGDYLFYLLIYHQGEPYLNKNFLHFVELAKAKRIFVTTSTNAHFLDKETAERTVESGLDSIIVSIDGVEQQTYEKYRVAGELDKALSGLKALVSARRKLKKGTPVILAQFIVMKHNEHEIGQIKQLGKKIGADRVLIKTAQVETYGEAKAWLPESETYRRYSVSEGEITPKRVGHGPCPRPWTSMLVNCDGTVVPCCFDKNGEHQSGTLTEDLHLSKTWNSKKYDDFRRQMLTDRKQINICANCSQGLRLYI